MLRFVILSLCLVQAVVSSSPRRFAPRNGRIVSGEVATRGQFPHQAAIFIDDGLSFGAGALISDKWVLTAGHVIAFASKWTIHLGAQILSASEPGRIVLTPQSAILHDGFAFTMNPDTFIMTSTSNDIGLFELPEAVTFTEFIKPAALPTLSQENESFLTREAFVSGWGLTDSNQSAQSNELMFARTSVIGVYECSKSLGTLVSSETLCTQGPDLTSTCAGDSGGAVVVDNGNSSFTVVGLVSFGSPDLPCDIGLPSGHTRVTYYLAWIEAMSGLPILP